MLTAMPRASPLICRCISSFPSLFRLERSTHEVYSRLLLLPPCVLMGCGLPYKCIAGETSLDVSPPVGVADDEAVPAELFAPAGQSMHRQEASRFNKKAPASDCRG
jgi:hypothetical protein